MTLIRKRFLKYSIKSMIHKRKKQTLLTWTSLELKTFARLRKWKDKPETWRKHLQLTYLIKDLCLESIKSYWAPALWTQFTGTLSARPPQLPKQSSPFSFHRWRNWGPERSSTLSKFTVLKSRQSQGPDTSGCKAEILNLGYTFRNTWRALSNHEVQIEPQTNKIRISQPYF